MGFSLRHPIWSRRVADRVLPGRGRFGTLAGTLCVAAMLGLALVLQGCASSQPQPIGTAEEYMTYGSSPSYAYGSSPFYCDPYSPLWCNSLWFGMPFPYWYGYGMPFYYPYYFRPRPAPRPVPRPIGPTHGPKPAVPSPTRVQPMHPAVQPGPGLHPETGETPGNFRR